MIQSASIFASTFLEIFQIYFISKNKTYTSIQEYVLCMCYWSKSHVCKQSQCDFLVSPRLNFNYNSPISIIHSVTKITGLVIATSNPHHLNNESQNASTRLTNPRRARTRHRHPFHSRREYVYTSTHPNQKKPKKVH